MTTPAPTPNQLPTVLGVGSLPPPLVEVIAAALHEQGRLDSEGDYPEMEPLYREFRMNQARAVLAAISETSRPEFGVKGEDRVKPYGRDRRSAQLEARRRRATFVTRRVTAWTAVEG